MTNIAKFRGAEFYLDGDFSQESGRRLSVSDIPFQDYVHIEDMGGKNESFTINGIIIGVDAQDTENKLLKLHTAFNKKGSGILELPHKNQRFTVFSELVSFTRGVNINMYSFTATFIIDKQENIPITITEQQLRALSLFAKTKDTVQLHLDKVMGWVDDAYSAVDTIEGRVKYAVNALYVIDDFKFTTRAVRERIRSIFSAVIFELDSDKQDTETKLNNLDDEHYQGYVDVIYDIASLEKSTLNTTKSVSDSFVDACEQEADTIIYGNEFSFTKQQSGVNVTEFSHTIRQMYIASLCFCVMQENLKTRKEAIYYRSKISDLLDSELDYMTFEVHDALTELVNTSTTYLTNALATLLPVITISGHNGEFPALWWSYRIYGNIDYYDDLINRNDIIDPDFMPLEFKAVVSG